MEVNNTSAWQSLLANIIELTGAAEGNIVIEIRRLPHHVWETINAPVHEFPNESEGKFLKEFKPILNLTVKAFCRCISHMHLVNNKETGTDAILNENAIEPKPMTEQEKATLAKFFNEL